MQYELTFLLDNEEDVKSITSLVTSAKGKVVEEKAWGKRTLAYPVKKKTSAFYYTWKVEMDSKESEELKKKLVFNEKLVRYLLLKKDD